MTHIRTLTAWFLLAAIASPAMTARAAAPFDGLESIAARFAAGEALACFPKWFNEADPTWAKDGDLYWLAFKATGDKKYLDLALAPEFMIPEHPADRNDSRQSGWWWPKRYSEMQSSMTADMREEWQRRLKLWAADVIGGTRIGDSDECMGHWGTLAAIDDAIGTTYLKDTPHFDDVLAAIREYIQRASGTTDSASWIEAFPGYDTNTVFIAGMIYLARPNDLPEFKSFASKFAKYLVWSVTPDFLDTEEHGDAGYPHDPVWHNRFCCGAVLAAVLDEGDPNRALLLDHLREMLPDPIHPSDFYRLRFSLSPVVRVFNPAWLPAQTSHPRPQGLLVADGRGIVIDRKGGDVATFDARNPTDVDHDEGGGFGSYRWYRVHADGRGEWLIDHLASYGGPSSSYNAAIPAGLSTVWGWDRGFVSAKETPTGFTATAQMRGPWTQPGTFSTYKFLDHLTRTVEYTGNAITVTDEVAYTDEPAPDSLAKSALVFIMPSKLGLFESKVHCFTQPQMQSDQAAYRWFSPLGTPLEARFSGAEIQQEDQEYGSFDQSLWALRLATDAKPTAKIVLTVTALGEPAAPTPPDNPPSPNNPPPPFALAWPAGTIPFDGTKGVQVPDFGDLSSISFGTWLKTDKTGPILSQDDGANPPGGHCPALVIDADGKLRASMFWHGSTSAQIVGPIVTDGQWHHVADTYGDGAESLYVDGVLTGQQTVPQTSYAAAYRYWLGAGYMTGWGADGWQYFTGQLRDPKAESRCWTAAEVAALAKPDDPPPIGFRVEYRRFSDRIERVEIIPLAP